MSYKYETGNKFSDRTGTFTIVTVDPENRVSIDAEYEVAYKNPRKVNIGKSEEELDAAQQLE